MEIKSAIFERCGWWVATWLVGISCRLLWLASHSINVDKSNVISPSNELITYPWDLLPLIMEDPLQVDSLNDSRAVFELKKFKQFRFNQRLVVLFIEYGIHPYWWVLTMFVMDTDEHNFSTWLAFEIATDFFAHSVNLWTGIYRSIWMQRCRSVIAWSLACMGRLLLS